MQTPKSRNSSSGALQKNSPRSVSSSEAAQKRSPQAGSSEASQKASPRVIRQLKTSPRYFEHTASSINLATKPPKEQSPKVSDHRSPRSSASEAKRPSRVSELESQVSQLEKDLNILKDQLCATEATKKQAEKDANEANQQILALSLKLEEFQKKHSNKLSSNEVASDHEQSQALISEPEAVQEKHSSDSAALEEIKQLKLQLQEVTESEATHSKNSETAQAELSQLKQNLLETQLLVGEMKSQLKQSEESEARSQATVKETLMQLENAKKMMDILRSDGVKGYDDLASDLEKSRDRVNYLEELVSELKAQINVNCGKDYETEGASKSKIESAATEINSVKVEVQQLRYALEAADVRYNDEQARSTEHIRIAHEMVETIKSESRDREAKLEAEIQTFKDIIEELKVKLLDKETELQGICELNEDLTKKLENTLSSHSEEDIKQELDKSKSDLDNLKALLMDKENELQNIIDENNKLKSLIKETSADNENGDIIYDIDSVRASEREALMKVSYLMEEVDKSNRKVARITEELEAAQSANSEMEAELRRIKVQSDQWRKAAEAAAAMISSGGNNGQLVERTGSMDSHYSPRMKKISSPYADDLDEDLLRKKNANMLKRFWKKPQK